MLEQHPDTRVAVFAVWEPILPTDWVAPSTGTLGRLSDPRVRQFWDRRHLLAKIIADSRGAQAGPKCCTSRGILWDLIAVYPPKTVWSGQLPPAIVFAGPVVANVPLKIDGF